MKRNIKEIIKGICKRKSNTLRTLDEKYRYYGGYLITTFVKNNLSLKTIQKVSRALNVPISEIIDEKPKKSGKDPDISGFIKVDGRICKIKDTEGLKKSIYITMIN